MEENNTQQPLNEDIKQTIDEVDQVWMKVEQQRPTFRFGVLVTAVGVGSYLGVGRHVVKMAKDVRAIRENVAAIGEFMAAESRYRDRQVFALVDALGKKSS